MDGINDGSAMKTGLTPQPEPTNNNQGAKSKGDETNNSGANSKGGENNDKGRRNTSHCSNPNMSQRTASHNANSKGEHQQPSATTKGGNRSTSTKTQRKESSQKEGVTPRANKSKRHDPRHNEPMNQNHTTTPDKHMYHQKPQTCTART